MLCLENLSKSYKNKEILKDVSLEIPMDSSLGLVGESGSGKSTLARIILGLEKPSSGSLKIENQALQKWQKQNQGAMSVVFQDYVSSVNPLFSVEDILEEPLWQRDQKLSICEKERLLSEVELPKNFLKRYSHELSGGELQRVCIARSLVTKPRFIVLDEALSSLDIINQVQIIELLQMLQKQYKMHYLLISHDLEITSTLCEKVAVLYQGSIVEVFQTDRLKEVKHEYTKKLLGAVMPFGGQ